MIRTVLSTLALIAGAIPVTAAGEVAPEIHKLCLQAADYRGCVEAQAGTPEYLGNKCPENHAYVGAGQCQRVYCDWVGLGGGHHEPTSCWQVHLALRKQLQLLEGRAAGWNPAPWCHRQG